MIADLQRSDTGRRAGHNQITGTQPHLLAQLHDNFTDIPDHLFDIAGLFFFAIDAEADRPFCEMV